jgi:hypothetical protein
MLPLHKVSTTPKWRLQLKNVGAARSLSAPETATPHTLRCDCSGLTITNLKSVLFSGNHSLLLARVCLLWTSSEAGAASCALCETFRLRAGHRPTRGTDPLIWWCRAGLFFCLVNWVICSCLREPTRKATIKAELTMGRRRLAGDAELFMILGQSVLGVRVKSPNVDTGTDSPSLVRWKVENPISPGQCCV